MKSCVSMNDLATHVWKNACLAQQPIFFSVDYSVDTNFQHQDKQVQKESLQCIWDTME